MITEPARFVPRGAGAKVIRMSFEERRQRFLRLTARIGVDVYVVNADSGAREANMRFFPPPPSG